MKKMSYMHDADLATIEIISTTKAKERAALKTKIPYTYGKKIETYDLVDEEIKHVHVDLSKASGMQESDYYRLLKKYRKQEYNKFMLPLKHRIIVVSAGIAAVAAMTYGMFQLLSLESSQPRIPTNSRPIQKAKPIPTQTIQKQNVRE